MPNDDEAIIDKTPIVELERGTNGDSRDNEDKGTGDGSDPLIKSVTRPPPPFPQRQK